MRLPATLRWIELDTAGFVQSKDRRLQAYQPACRLERAIVDPFDRSARKTCLAQLAGISNNALVITEGIRYYLANDELVDLAGEVKHKILSLSGAALMQRRFGE